MNIKRMDENPVVVFDDIAPGTVFGYCEFVYMKMHSFSDKINNAVRLDSGEAVSFDGDHEINPLDVELVIK